MAQHPTHALHRVLALFASLAHGSCGSYPDVISSDAASTVQILPQDLIIKKHPLVAKPVLIHPEVIEIASPTINTITSATSKFATATKQLLENASYNEIAKYYFQSELHNMYTQSMKIGGYGDYFDSETQPYIYYSHLEKSLQRELNRVREQKSREVYDDITNETMSVLCENGKTFNSTSRVQCSEDKNVKNSTMSQTKHMLQWENWGFVDMYSFFKCDEHAYDEEKPLYNTHMWNILKENFDPALFENDDQDASPPPPYYAEISEGKGRGTFAARDIKEGELVHDGSRNTVFWRDGSSWRTYVMSLRSRKMVCDVLEWTWIQSVTDSGEPLLCLNLNDGAFMNDGGEEESNIATRSSTSLEFYAIRDIEEGDELLYDYDLFDTRWDEFDL